MVKLLFKFTMYDKATVFVIPTTKLIPSYSKEKLTSTKPDGFCFLLCLPIHTTDFNTNPDERSKVFVLVFSYVLFLLFNRYDFK